MEQNPAHQSINETDVPPTFGQKSNLSYPETAEAVITQCWGRVVVASGMVAENEGLQSVQEMEPLQELEPVQELRPVQEVELEVELGLLVVSAVFGSLELGIRLCSRSRPYCAPSLDEHDCRASRRL
ncbi:hypothetical protein RvY_14473 [Ramazzottius varieornatus]|uniref:Uncharacterized protein n=1 Tax=Ramazzottius varieornatus TaxID=947166 RepID=A0A1D1VT62_RAMVA|nr:hypothetical protein RvY_14473 [Ramazzottius varieornatus]